MSRRRKQIEKERAEDRINIIYQADLVRKRVDKVLRHCNLVWSRNVWRSFEAMVAREIPHDAERQKVLKRLFSKWGSGILAADSRYIEIIETKLKIK
jgi:hypothetical protein